MLNEKGSNDVDMQRVRAQLLLGNPPNPHELIVNATFVHLQNEVRWETNRPTKIGNVGGF